MTKLHKLNTDLGFEAYLTNTVTSYNKVNRSEVKWNWIYNDKLSNFRPVQSPISSSFLPDEDGTLCTLWKLGSL